MRFQITSRVFRVSLFVGGALLLGAGNCGGGDGGSEEPPADPCAVAGACGGGTGGSGTGGTGTGGTGGDVVDDGLRPTEWQAFENEVVTRVNALRAQGGSCGSGASLQTFPASGPLRIDSKLVAAARGHADDMEAQDYFSHDSLDGRSPFDRIDDAGYTAFGAGENIAAGQTTPAIVVEGWRTSPGHCVNLYSLEFNEIGVGYTYDNTDMYRHYWVQNFGIR